MRESVDAVIRVIETCGLPSVAATDVARMRERLFFDGAERGRKLSA